MASFFIDGTFVGLFSSKKKHYVDTQVQRVVEDSGVPKSELAALVNALFKDSNITDSILERSLNNGTRQFEKFYRYAEDPQNTGTGYYYGLPNIFQHSSADGNAAASAQIATEVGSAVTIEYMYFRPLNNIHAGMKHITDNLGFNPTTGKLVSLYSNNNTDVYLEKMVAVHESLAGQEPETSAMGSMDTAAYSSPDPTQPEWATPSDLANLTERSEMRVGASEVESCEIHTIWRTFDADGNQALDANGDPIYGRAIIVLNLTSYDQDREYYQAKYKINATNVIGYWIYDTTTGGNTTLNQVFDVPSVINPGTYFPFVVFRSEGTNRAATSLHTTTQYLTTVKLLDKLGLDFQEIADAMHADTDINDIDQAVMMMAVPLSSTDQIDIEYLYRYFEDLHGNLPTDAKGKYGALATVATAGPFGAYGGYSPEYSITLTDADFEMRLSFTKITFRYVPGTVGTGVIGECSNTTTTETGIDAIPFNGTGTIPTGVESLTKRYIRRQHNEHVYGEITITNPKSRYRIYKNMAAEAGLGDERLLIPLEYGICQQMNPFTREKLYYRSLHMVYNSHQVQVIKWYQRGAFKVLLAVIAIILIITTGFGSELLVAIEAGAAAVAVFILQKVIIGIILKGLIFEFVFTQLVELIGIEAAAVLAVITAIVTGRMLFKNGMILSSTAQNLLQVTTGLIKGTQNVIQDSIMDLYSDVEEWQTFVKDKQEELDEKMDLLDSNIGVDPFEFIGLQPLEALGEDPDSYYSRTIHAGNVGAESLKLIENYCSISLRLPTIQDTILDMGMQNGT